MNNNTGFGSTTILLYEQIPPYALYILFGSIAIISNIMVVFVFAIDKTMRNRYQMLIGLAIADLVNAIATFAAGVFRVVSIYTVLATGIQPSLTIWDCASQPYPALLAIGTQLPSAVTFVISVERLLAIYFPFWYRFNVTPKSRNIALLSCVLAVLVSLLAAYINVYVNYKNVPEGFFICTIPGAFTVDYQAYDCVMIISGHVLGFIITLLANRAARLKLTRNISADLNNYLRQEMVRIRLQLIVTAFEVLLIAIPQFILFNPGGFIKLFALQSPYCYAIFCASSCVNLCIYVITNGEFRRRLIFYLTAGHFHSATITNVAPMSSRNAGIHGK